MGLCPGCVADLPFVGTACPRCALPLPVPVACPKCTKRPPPFQACFALFCYAYPIDRLIQRMKFKRHLAIAREFGALLAHGVSTHQALTPQCLVPVPLHRARLTARGFNQALEIARPVAKALSIPLDFTSCIRARNTAAQTGLPAKQRARNVRGAFRVHKPLPYKHVAIVDDVITTGHTAAALARALRRTGIKQVDLWVCARTVRP